MRKATTLLFMLWPCLVFAQCLTALPPPACNGSEPQLADNESLNFGTTKWYSGATTTLSSLTLNGGTLVVCGNLTIDRFYMDSGTIFIRPGARFVIGSGIGAGLILKGNSSIYNYGTFEIQRNLSLDNGYASPAKPNIVINATASSVFNMGNQYFVINNPDSWFVNNGSMQAWGIITDQLSSPGAVCLGLSSTTRMAVLINKIADSYRAPAGNACLNVYQFSEFRNRLTNSPVLFACLGSGHSSYSGCGGCPANNWGAAQVFTGCTSCNAIGVLDLRFAAFEAKAQAEGNKLEWTIHTASRAGLFTILRSGDGLHYTAVDSFAVTGSNIDQYTRFDKQPLPGNNYYMIQYSLPENRGSIRSNPVKIKAIPSDQLNVFPIPFENRFFIECGPGALPEKIILTDMSGRNISIRHRRRNGTQVEVELVNPLQAGIYIVHVQTGSMSSARTVISR